MQEFYQILFFTPLVFAVSFATSYFLKDDFKLSHPARVAFKLSLIGLFALIILVFSSSFFKVLYPANNQFRQISQRVEFARFLQSILKDPKLVNKDMKEILNQKFRLNSFSRSEKDFYYKSLYDFYDCQLAFYQDAYAAYTTKVPTKSDRRKYCQQVSGEFFGIPLLLPKEQSTQNDLIIQKIANGQTVDSQGKPLEISDQFFQQNIGEQIRNLNALKFFFDQN